MSAGAHPGARRHPQDIRGNRGPSWGSYPARHTSRRGTCRRLDLSRGWVRTSAFRRVLLCSHHNAGAAAALRHSFLPHFSKPHCRTHRRVRRRIGGYRRGLVRGDLGPRPAVNHTRHGGETRRLAGRRPTRAAPASGTVLSPPSRQLHRRVPRQQRLTFVCIARLSLDSTTTMTMVADLLTAYVIN